MRIANVDMRNNHSQCPPGLVYNVTEGRRLCHKLSLAPGCSSSMFSTLGVEYSRVCGKVIGYQYLFTDQMDLVHPELDLDCTKPMSMELASSHMAHQDNMSGLLLQLMMKHLILDIMQSVLVAHVLIRLSPLLESTLSFVGNDYYYENGSRMRSEDRYYFDDPLWDGEGCEGENNECCDRGGPWFCKQLPQPTQDDIEMRVCLNSFFQDEDVVLEQIEFYIQ